MFHLFYSSLLSGGLAERFLHFGGLLSLVSLLGEEPWGSQPISAKHMVHMVSTLQLKLSSEFVGESGDPVASHRAPA